MPDFVENVIVAFKNIIKEIEKGSSEHDIRYRFVKYFVEELLGYEPKYIRWEKKRADLTIIDENDFAVIKIETKRPTENIDKKDHEEQAFRYEEETTRFIGLTNFLQFKLWEVRKTGSELRLNLDFSKILEQRRPIENLSSEEKIQILFLNNLTKETLFDPSKYEKFDETYARIDITKDAGFRKLLDRWSKTPDTPLHCTSFSKLSPNLRMKLSPSVISFAAKQAIPINLPFLSKTPIPLSSSQYLFMSGSYLVNPAGRTEDWVYEKRD